MESRKRPLGWPLLVALTNGRVRPPDERLVATVLAEHGHVDVLVSNEGKSIRRSVADSYQRFHDIERTNAVNYKPEETR
jgi:NAD(P)-dependent dehydrogenase (short-subunit alcohol dehydrogenase family)